MKPQEVENIRHITANFDRNGLVDEVAYKINEIIDAVNALTALTVAAKIARGEMKV